MVRTIGPYEIVEELGRGGMGVVYKAREKSLDRFVAIKMLGNQLTEDDSLVQRFLREARAVADLNHPNLVQVFRVDRHEDQPYFAMEYVEGESLKSLIQRERRMQPLRALQILKEVALGLSAAHDKGVVHRDIKPENVMSTRYGGVKVVDFGIARVEEPGTRLTTTGMGLGTPSYLSPEVCLSQDVDQRSDIFSLGVVLFEMLTGETPFQSESPFELMTKVVEARIPDIKALNPNVDDGVKQILAKMIAKRPKLRYQNCNELVSDIEDYSAGRVPRYARDASINVADSAPVAGSASDGDAPTEIQSATPAVAEPTSPTERVLGHGATEGAGAGAEKRRSRGGRLVAVLALLLVVGGAGAWGLWTGVDGPWRQWFAGAGGEIDRADPADSNPTTPAESDSATELSALAVPEAASAGTEINAAEPEAPVTSAVEEAGPLGASADSVARNPEHEGVASTAESVEDEPADAVNRAEPADPLSRAVAEVIVPDPAPAVESSGDPVSAASPATSSDAAVAPARSAEPMPVSPRIAVVAAGDPAVAATIAGIVKDSLARASFDVVDEQLMDGLFYAESLAGVARTARDNGVDVLVYVDLVPTGERELLFYGRSELQLLATLEVRVVDLHEQRNFGRPVVRSMEYVALTADRKAREAAGPVARTVVNRLRATQGEGSSG
jgi:serine/threonine-protein kinase